MKSLVFTILLLTLFLDACALGNTSGFNPDKLIYLSDGSGFAINKLSTVLPPIINKNKPIVLFVHGRGGEPNKSLHGGIFVKGRAVHKLEAGYGVSVIMYNWNSRAIGLDRTSPLSHMKEAAAALERLLTEIVRFYKNNPGTPQMVLHAHSMGNIVLENLVDNMGDRNSDLGIVFSNVVLSSSDADNQGHHFWVAELARSTNVYVTINRDDRALRLSNDSRPKGSLPLGIDPGSPLAEGANYVRFTGLGKSPGKKLESHEIFNKRVMQSQVYICEFFSDVFNGVSPLFEKDNATRTKTGIFQLTFRRDPNHACFKKP